MQESAQDRLNARALLLTTGLLLAPAVAFFLYYGLDTLNNPVFGIDFVPYHLAGRLLAEGDLEPVTNYAETGGFFATSGPFLETFRTFYPQTTYATRWVYLPAYLWIFRPLAGLDFPTAARIWLAVNALLTLACLWLLWSAGRRPVLSSQLRAWRRGDRRWDAQPGIPALRRPKWQAGAAHRGRQRVRGVGPSPGASARPGHASPDKSRSG